MQNLESMLVVYCACDKFLKSYYIHFYHVNWIVWILAYIYKQNFKKIFCMFQDISSKVYLFSNSIIVVFELLFVSHRPELSHLLSDLYKVVSKPKSW